MCNNVYTFCKCNSWYVSGRRSGKPGTVLAPLAAMAEERVVSRGLWSWSWLWVGRVPGKGVGWVISYTYTYTDTYTSRCTLGGNSDKF